jgi:hypothetical protein
MKKQTIKLMYWLPLYLIGMIWLIGIIYYGSFESLVYVLALGISVIASLLWFRFWDRKMDEVRKEQR